MTLINLIGLVAFVLMLGIGGSLTWFTIKRLKDIDGFSGKYSKENDKGNLISKGK